MQEGVAVLFKRLADIDVFDLGLDASDPDGFVETVLRPEPTFGGINLKDIRAPEGLAIYERLREGMTIPVFHENLDSTAVVAARCSWARVSRRTSCSTGPRWRRWSTW